MTGTIVRGKVNRGDLALWDGRTTSVSRLDASGGTITGLTIGNEVDVLQNYGGAYTRGTIANAIQQIGTSSKRTLVFNPGTWEIDDDLTIPANYTCHIPAGCVFDVASGKTLTFSGPIQRECETWTSGAGTVAYTPAANVLLHRIDLTAASIGLLLYPRTAAEISVSMIPVDYSYPELHFLRYGITGSAADQSALIQAAISVAAVNGGSLIAPKPLVSYNLGTAGITLPAKVTIVGVNEDAVQFTYSGTGIAIDCSGSTNGLQNIYLTVTSAAGSGIRFGNVSRRAGLNKVTVQNTYATPASVTGAGLIFRTLTTDTAFSGDFLMSWFYSLGFKYGMQVDCFELPEKTWTSIIGQQTFLVGPGAGVCAGSIGIWADSTSNLVGSFIYGGTIESFEVPIQIDSGGNGLSYYGDIEGNSSNVPSLGASCSCEVYIHPAGVRYSVAANQTTNVWMKERHLNGVYARETYYGQQLTTYDGSGAEAESGFYRGASAIDGGSPTLALGIHMSTSGDLSAPERNWIVFGTMKLTHGTSPPASGTWTQGDVCFKTNAAAGGSNGWTCTTGGSPGTWKAWGNVAA